MWGGERSVVTAKGGVLPPSVTVAWGSGEEILGGEEAWWVHKARKQPESNGRTTAHGGWQGGQPWGTRRTEGACCNVEGAGGIVYPKLQLSARKIENLAVCGQRGLTTSEVNH